MAEQSTTSKTAKAILQKVTDERVYAINTGPLDAEDKKQALLYGRNSGPHIRCDDRGIQQYAKRSEQRIHERHSQK